MKKILILTIGFDWWGSWKMAALMENFLNKSYDTTTLVFYNDTWVFRLKWKKININTFSKLNFPWIWYIAPIPHIISTIKYIKKEKPDIVISVWTYCNFLWLVAKKFLNFKLLLSQHEHITSRKEKDSMLSSYNLIFYMIKKLIWNNKIICVSNECKLDTVKEYKIQDDQAITIYNWLDFNEIKKLSNEKIDLIDKYIINIWWLNDLKNQELLIKAYSKSKIKETYKLLLLWKWEKEKELKDLAKKLNINDYVIFGWFDKNPYKYLKKASLFCFTSKSESFWLVLLESLILWIPIITVPVSWAIEILKNWKYWIIIKDWEEHNLIKELDSFEKWQIKKLKDENRIKYLNKNFSIKAMENKYIKIINSL